MTQPGRGRGQPAFEPTDKQRQMVQVLRANGDILPIIAANLGITEKTLRKHFRVELADGHGQVRAAIGAALVRSALGGNVYAMKYWLSCFGGEAWRITERREIGGLEGGSPIQVSPERVTIFLPHNNREEPPGDQ